MTDPSPETPRESSHETGPDLTAGEEAAAAAPSPGRRVRRPGR